MMAKLDYHNNRQLNIIRVTRSNMKRVYFFARFCSSVEPPFQSFSYGYLELKELLIKYPYCKIPIKIHKASIDPQHIKFKDFLSHNIVKDAIAFGCLVSTSASILSIYHSKLFDYDEESRGKQLGGKTMFVNYFSGRLEEIKSGLRRQDSHEEVQYALKVLAYMIDFGAFSKLSGPGSDDLGSLELTRPTLTEKAYLLRIKISQNDYLGFLDSFLEEFVGCKQSDQKLRAAFAVFSIKDFHDTLPQALIRECLQCFQEHTQQLQNWEYYEIFSNLFEVPQSLCYSFIEAATEHLQSQLSKELVSIRMPVIMKLMNLRHRQRMDNRVIGYLIRDNPIKFNSIFFKKNTNKEVFLEVLSRSCPNNKFPEETQVYFDKFILQEFRNLAERETEVHLKEVVRTYKLTLNFLSNITPRVLKQIAQLVKQRIIPAYSDSTSIYFFSMVLLFRSTSSDFQKSELQTLAQELLLALDKEYQSCEAEYRQTEVLEQIIDIHYQLIRKDINLRQPTKQLAVYDYRRVQSFQKLVYVCYLILKSPGVHKSLAIKMFSGIHKQLSNKLAMKSFSSHKHLLTIAHTMYKIDELNHTQRPGREPRNPDSEETLASMLYLWYKMEMSLLGHFKSQKPAFKVTDFVLLKRYSYRYRNDMKHFREFLSKEIDQPQNHHTNLKEYLKFYEKRNSGR